MSERVLICGSRTWTDRAAGVVRDGGGMTTDGTVKRWCEDFVLLRGYGSDRRTHAQCRRCGRVSLGTGVETLQVGPCVKPPPPDGYDGSLT